MSGRGIDIAVVTITDVSHIPLMLGSWMHERRVIPVSTRGQRRRMVNVTTRAALFVVS